MNAIASVDAALNIANDPDDVLTISTSNDREWLCEQFRTELGSLLRGIRRRAAIICRMKDLGMELPQCAEVAYLLRIAAGVLDAEMYYVIGWCQDDASIDLLNRAQFLLPEDQNRIARNDAFDVAVLGGEPIRVPALSLTKTHRKQLFTKGRVRSLTEQSNWLRENKAKADASTKRTQASLYSIDRRNRCVVIESPGVLTAADISHIGQALMSI